MKHCTTCTCETTQQKTQREAEHKKMQEEHEDLLLRIHANQRLDEEIWRKACERAKNEPLPHLRKRFKEDKDNA